MALRSIVMLRVDVIISEKPDNLGAREPPPKPKSLLHLQMAQSFFPIEKLPLELLFCTFSLCCKADFTDIASPDAPLDNDIIVFQACSPLTLSHVSSRWRSIARELSTIWSFIRIKDATSASKTSLWLEHSGNHPLYILIQDVHPDRVRQAYDMLYPHASRWRQFRIIARESSLQDIDQGLSITPFLIRGAREDPTPILSAPELTTLDLREQRYSGVRYSSTMDISMSCPKLRKLIVSDLAVDWSRLGLHISLGNITSLEIYQIFLLEYNLIQLMTAVGQMRALQHARICVITPHDMMETAGCSMIHPDLRTLRLEIHAPCSALWGWFRNLHAPQLLALSLHHFLIRKTDGSDPWHVEQEQIGWAATKEVVHFPSLTQFNCSLGPEYRCLESLAAIMEAIPTITRMKFEDDTGMLHRLASLLTVGGPRPQVEHVEIRTRTDTPEHRELLSKAVALLNSEATMTIAICN
ncbi:hypothetical protein FRC02_001409 [Tulasnella sp. 418]|nr:hypothetical protein FRC02_001409 [Tulasnella sp. 418]